MATLPQHPRFRCPSVSSLALCLLFAAGCGSGEVRVVDNEDEPAKGFVDQALDDLAADAQLKPGEEKPFERRAQFVDRQTALLDNPRLVEVENEINAVDPLSAVSQGYFKGASDVTVMQIEHQARLSQAMNGRFPTFNEIKSDFDNVGAKFTGLKPWQMYAYDAETGKVTILSDPDAEMAVKTDGKPGVEPAEEPPPARKRAGKKRVADTPSAGAL